MASVLGVFTWQQMLLVEQHCNQLVYGEEQDT